MKLFDSVISSCAFRTRIALNLKGLPYQRISINLLAGEQRRGDFLALNPNGLVPILVDRDNVLTDSFAIIEYLDELYPNPAFLPATVDDRAQLRAFALSIACGMQPLHPERVEEFLAYEMGAHQDRVLGWCRHWISVGMNAVEARLRKKPDRGLFCFRDTPTLADIFLVPEVFAAQRRFGMDIRESWPTISRIYDQCLAVAAFCDALPDSLQM